MNVLSRRVLLLGAILSVLCHPSPAKPAGDLASNSVEFNSVLKIGDAAPAWKDLPGTDDKEHSLDDLKSAEVVVVVFTCNSCPTARDYEQRIMSFVNSHCAAKDGKPARVQLVAINVNKVPEDSFDKMKERVKEQKLTYPYLYDETQKIAKDFGAITTPEFFVLNKDRKVVFMGAMDDNSEPNQAKKNHLVEAVNAVLAEKQLATLSVPPRGCRIRFVQERKKK